MSAEWLHSVQDVAHYSIQTSNTETDYQDYSNSESIPLLRDNNRSCTRNLWIVFFSVFLGVGLFTGSYLLITEATQWSISESYYSLITRKGWKADKVNFNSTVPLLQLPLRKVLFTKTDSPECVNEDECSRQVHEVQKDHVNRLQEPDIIYNFLIAGDGQTYEGRGWKYQAFVSNSGDKHTLVVAFVGIFNETLPSKKQIDQAKSFLEVAENRGKLSQCYAIESRCDLNQTKTERIFNYVISHLKAYFIKKRDQC